MHRETFPRIHRGILYNIFLIALFAATLFCGKVFSQGRSINAGDTVVMKAICNIAGASLDRDPAATDSLARILYQRASRAGNPDFIGKAAALISITEIKLRKRSAVSWYDTALAYLAQTRNSKWVAYTNLQMGYSMGEKFQFQSSIKYLLRAAGNYASVKDSAMLITTYTAISNMFQEFGDHNSAKQYAKMAVALVERTNDRNKDRRWGAYALLGICYNDSHEYDKALSIHLGNISNAGNDWVLFLSYNNVGSTLLKKNLYGEAEKYLMQALGYAQKINDNNSYATIYDNLARVNVLTKRYPKAKQYLGLAQAYAQKENVPQKLLDVYETGWMLAKAMGDNSAALDFLTKRTDIKDSLLNAERSRAVYDLRIKYESDEKEKENQRLQYLNALKTAEKEKAESDKRKLVVGAAVTLLLVTALFLLLYRNRMIKSKLAEEQVFTKAIMEVEQAERIRIARDLHDSIGQMLSVVKMNVSSLQYEFPENKTAGISVNLVDNALVELRNISHNLMPEDLNFGLFAAIENICEKISASGETEVVLNVPEALRKHPFEKTDMLTIYRIVQEILNNTMKHAAAGLISITCVKDENNIVLSVTDNGKGFNTVEVQKSRGLGWKNISARVRMLNGKMQVKSEQSRGTQIEITIPAV